MGDAKLAIRGARGNARMAFRAAEMCIGLRTSGEVPDTEPVSQFVVARSVASIYSP